MSLGLQRLSATTRVFPRQLSRFSTVRPSRGAWVPRAAPTTRSPAPSAIRYTTVAKELETPAPADKTLNNGNQLSAEDTAASFLPEANGNNHGTDWSKSYHGLSSQAFSKEIAEILLAPIDPLDVEMKPGKFETLTAWS